MTLTLIEPLMPSRAAALCVAALMAMAAACGGPGTAEDPTPAAAPTIAQPPSIPVKLAEIVTPTPPPATPTPRSQPEVEATPVAGYKPDANMYRFFSRPGHPVKVALEGLDRARANKDSTQVPIILEVMRFFPSDAFQQEAQETLTLLTGQPPEGQEWGWDEWMSWVWANSADYPVPDGYATWKSVFLSGGIDMRYREFLPPDGKVAPDIDLTELIWGGIAPDQVPPLVDPDVVTVEEADYLLPDDRVFGVSIGGEHRAYPLRITNVHEIVNDELGGEPIALTHCVLCGSGVVYRAELGGERTRFGTSGLIYRSNPVIYDLENRTLWLQLTGRPVAGPAADTGGGLEPVPSVLTTWEEWSALHPDTTALSILNEIYPPTAYGPELAPGSPLETYLSTDETVFPVWLRSDALAPKDRALGVRVGDDAKAYPVEALQAARALNDEVGGTRIVIVASPNTEAARVYERGDVELSLPDDDGGSAAPAELVDSGGGAWQVTEEALVSRDDPGRRLARLPAQIALWFSWHAFFPETELGTAE